MFKRESIIFGLMFLISSCGPNTSDSKDRSSSTGTTGTSGTKSTGNVKNCPDAMKPELTDFLLKTGKDPTGLSTIANNLKANKIIYPPTQLKGFGGAGDPIGYAYAHCAPGTELMKFSDEKCQMNGREEDIKKIKTQCALLKDIVDATPKFATIGKTWVAGSLTVAEKNDFDAYIKLIIDGFAD